MIKSERSLARKGVSLLFVVFVVGILLGSLVSCRSTEKHGPEMRALEILAGLYGVASTT